MDVRLVVCCFDTVNNFDRLDLILIPTNSAVVSLPVCRLVFMDACGNFIMQTSAMRVEISTDKELELSSQPDNCK